MGLERMLPADSALLLGFDSSTQGLKVSAVDRASRAVVYHTSINYDRHLPRFGTSGGVHAGNDGEVTAPTVMLAAALDLLLQQMRDDGFPFSQVAAISGSGQQHGSVYWRQGARQQLQALDPARSLEAQINEKVLSRTKSPIWMDSSTSKQCRQLEAAVGGAQALATLTGSRAYERFTGNQIKKIVDTEPEVYASTERISLVSSFMCSLLLGDYASIDTSDGAGMNLMDLQAQDWSLKVLQAIDPTLHAKLGPLVPAHTVLGKISAYMVKRHGFAPNCAIVAWSGDNPNSVAGVGLHAPGDICLSLGTSDTLFSIIEASKSKPGLEGHIFVNPVDPKSHMAMLCYKNGSLAREDVMKRVAGTWKDFNNILAETPPGNNGNIGFFIREPEIVPPIFTPGTRRFNASGQAVNEPFPPAVEARAIVESQMLSLRLHSERLGLKPKTIIATGGASVNPAITKITADVFGVPVYSASQSDSASFGAALRALHGLVCAEKELWVPFDEACGKQVTPLRVVAEPDETNTAMYAEMVGTYEDLEAAVLRAC